MIEDYMVRIEALREAVRLTAHDENPDVTVVAAHIFYKFLRGDYTVSVSDAGDKVALDFIGANKR